MWPLSDNKFPVPLILIQELQIYVGHVAAIFSLDYDFQLDVLVTGSADSTVKVWVMSSGEMLQTLTQHRSAWITQVGPQIIYRVPTETGKPGK